MKQQVALNCPYLVERKKVRVDQIKPGNVSDYLLGFTQSEVLIQSQALSVIEENGSRKLFCPHLNVTRCRKEDKHCPYV